MAMNDEPRSLRFAGDCIKQVLSVLQKLRVVMRAVPG